jgi:hypothetical protein
MRVIRVGRYEIHSANPAAYYVVEGVVTAAAHPYHLYYLPVSARGSIQLKNLRHNLSSCQESS